MLDRFFSYLLKNQVIFALFLIVFGWLVVEIRDIILSIFFSYIIMAALLPISEFLRKKKFPRVLSVLIPFFGVILLIFLLIMPLIPFITSQIESLAKIFPQYLNKSATIFGFKVDASQIDRYVNGELDALSRNAFDLTTKFFGGILSAVTISIISVYLLYYNDKFKKFVASMFHKSLRPDVLKTIDKVNDKLGAWLRGQIILCLFIGFLSWVALLIIGLPYALPLALLAGLLEVVPTLGPTLSAVPAVIVALTLSPATAITVVLAYFLIQMFEGQVVVPKVMERAVGLNPIIVILAIMIGASLMGLGGALLAIPFVSFIQVIYQSVTEMEE